jgi:hypothetical protein
MTGPAVVGVVGAGNRTRLLAALEGALPIRFKPYERFDPTGMDALLVLPGAFVPAGASGRLPTLVFCGAEPAAPGAVRRVTLQGLDYPLRGAVLSDAWADALPSAAMRGDEICARVDGAPAWLRRGRLELVASAPAELEPQEALRERIIPGRSLALLALVHFLRSVAGPRAWSPGPLRAAFVLDDPNLHWPTYGHVHFARLAAHAAEHRYHMAVAMVPLDGWLAHPRVVRLFRDAPERLSLCVHGNDHTGPELSRPRSEAEGALVAAHALRRMQGFERRTGVRAAHVMVPPHEELSESAAGGLHAAGYEAVCTTRPYPWAAPVGTHWLTRPEGAGPLAGFGSRDHNGTGLPVLLRAGFQHPREDLALRAFLGQPLILYGHHDDLRGGLDLLAGAAADINALGDVRWGSLEQIARASVETRREGNALAVRVHSRRVSVELAPGVDRLVLTAREGRLHVRLPGGAELETRTGEAVAVAAPGSAEIWSPLPPAPPSPAGAGAPRLWPIARRLAGESRDRMQAVLGLPRAA